MERRRYVAPHYPAPMDRVISSRISHEPLRPPPSSSRCDALPSPAVGSAPSKLVSSLAGRRGAGVLHSTFKRPLDREEGSSSDSSDIGPVGPVCRRAEESAILQTELRPVREKYNLSQVGSDLAKFSLETPSAAGSRRWHLRTPATTTAVHVVSSPEVSLLTSEKAFVHTAAAETATSTNTAAAASSLVSAESTADAVPRAVTRTTSNDRSTAVSRDAALLQTLRQRLMSKSSDAAAENAKNSILVHRNSTCLSSRGSDRSPSRVDENQSGSSSTALDDSSNVRSSSGSNERSSSSRQVLSSRTGSPRVQDRLHETDVVAPSETLGSPHDTANVCYGCPVSDSVGLELLPISIRVESDAGCPDSSVVRKDVQAHSDDGIHDRSGNPADDHVTHTDVKTKEDNVADDEGSILDHCADLDYDDEKEEACCRSIAVQAAERAEARRACAERAHSHLCQLYGGRSMQSTTGGDVSNTEHDVTGPSDTLSVLRVLHRITCTLIHAPTRNDASLASMDAANLSNNDVVMSDTHTIAKGVEENEVGSSGDVDWVDVAHRHVTRVYRRAYMTKMTEQRGGVEPVKYTPARRNMSGECASKPKSEPCIPHDEGDTVPSSAAVVNDAETLSVIRRAMMDNALLCRLRRAATHAELRQCACAAARAVAEMNSFHRDYAQQQEQEHRLKRYDSFFHWSENGGEDAISVPAPPAGLWQNVTSAQVHHTSPPHNRVRRDRALDTRRRRRSSSQRLCRSGPRHNGAVWWLPPGFG